MLPTCIAQRRSVLALLALSMALTGQVRIATGAQLPTGQAAAAGLAPERLARLDAFMRKAVADNRVPGAVALIARRGRIVHHEAYGVADRTTGRPMRKDEIFRIYSMTKPVTSVALLMLYEEGKFQLDDPLDQYIPAFRDLKVFAGTDAAGAMILETPKRKPTIRDAFRHTLGVSAGSGPPPVARLYVEKGILINTIESLQQQIDLLGEVPLLFHPGERWLYGYGHDVQAWLVEHFSGKRLDQFMRERIFEPLGMRDTGYDTGLRQQERAARLHDIAPPSPASPGLDMRPSTYERFANIPIGTMGLWSTAEDFARFSQMLANGGSLGSVRILGRKTVELLAQNHLPPEIGTLARDNNAPGTGYGLGFSVSLDPALEGNLGSAGTFGWTGAATTRFFIDPDEQLVGIVMAQQWPYDARLLEEFQTMVYQAIVD